MHFQHVIKQFCHPILAEFISLEDQEQPVEKYFARFPKLFQFLKLQHKSKLMIRAWTLEITMRQLSAQNLCLRIY